MKHIGNICEGPLQNAYAAVKVLPSAFVSLFRLIPFENGQNACKDTVDIMLRERVQRSGMVGLKKY